jgi:uncharacterized membrane protein YkvA (DUF1232 family)
MSAASARSRGSQADLRGCDGFEAEVHLTTRSNAPVRQRVSMAIFQRIRQWASRIKRDAVTLWFAYRHPGTPWFAKLLAAFVVAYALSPIDLIPDFIPVLGYLDDVLLLPGLIWLNIRLIPADVLEECRQRADQWMKEQGAKPRSIAGAVFILAIWIGLGAGLWAWFGTQK